MPESLPTREAAIALILDQNDRVRSLLNQIDFIKNEANQNCNELQNQANQLVGRNDAIRELYGLSQEELEQAAEANKKKRSEAPSPPAPPPPPGPPAPPVVDT